MTRPRLSVLDQSPIAEGGTGAQALKNTIDLAQLAEELGYGRYWLAEHHGTPMLACGAPEIMVAAVAAATSRIRVGTGGVMLSHYSPFKVAEVFSVIAGLYGKRIDLGIGRAPGGDLETIYALQRDRRQLLPEDYAEQVQELLAYFEDGFPPDHPLAKLARLPGTPGAPVVWLLGTSPDSAVMAAELGLPYAVADFINPGSATSGRLYREMFVPSQRLKRPEVTVAVGAVCAETDDEAQTLSSSWRMAITQAGRGEFGPRAGRAAGARLPGRRQRRHLRGAPGRRRIARDRPRRARADRRRLRRRGDPRAHPDPQSPRPPPLLRAARRGIRSLSGWCAGRAILSNCPKGPNHSSRLIPGRSHR